MVKPYIAIEFAEHKYVRKHINGCDLKYNEWKRFFDIYPDFWYSPSRELLNVDFIWGSHP